MKKHIQILLGFMDRLNTDHVGAFAAQAAYFVVLSFIPFVMFLVTVAQYIPPLQNENLVIEMLLRMIPENGALQEYLLGIIREIYSKSTAVVPITALFALWSAGKGLQALTNGVNAIYHVEETRNYIITRIRSTFYTLLFVIALIGSLVLLVFGNSIQGLLTQYIPVLGKITGYVIGMRTSISLGILIIVFLMIYRFLPNRKTNFRNQLPGAVISAVSWSLFSLGFSIYIDVYDGMSNMYGSLTTLILILLWVYFCMYIILIGAEINAYFEARFRKLHQMASERIRMEYREFMNNFREESEDEEEEDVSGEARQAHRY